jgi:hypothetical protein
MEERSKSLNSKVLKRMQIGKEHLTASDEKKYVKLLQRKSLDAFIVMLQDFVEVKFQIEKKTKSEDKIVNTNCIEKKQMFNQKCQKDLSLRPWSSLLHQKGLPSHFEFFASLS